MKPFPFWQDYGLTLANANDIIEFDAHGAWISCYLAAEEFEISYAGQPWLKFNQGLQAGWDEQPVRIKIRPKAGAVTFPNAIIVRLGVGHYVDARFSVSAPLQISAGAVIQEKAAATLVTPADVVLVAATNTLIFAANAARRVARIRNTSLTTATRVSTTAASLTAGAGELINPGEVLETAVSGAIYARSTGTPTLVLSEENY